MKYVLFQIFMIEKSFRKTNSEEAILIEKRLTDMIRNLFLSLCRMKIDTHKLLTF